MVNNRIHPSDVWMNPAILHQMLDALAECAELHSITVNYQGRTVLEGAWEPYSLTDSQMMYSLSAVATAICIGLAVKEGHLDLTGKASAYLGDELPPEYDPAFDEVTVSDLLTMRAGSPGCCDSHWFSGFSESWLEAWLKVPRIRKDIGRVFHFDPGCCYVLSVIVTKVMGRNCLSLLDERLFSPMGLGHITWLESPEGHSAGGWGLYLSSRKTALIADLLSRKGWWYGRQLIPGDWIEEMSRTHVAIPGAEGTVLPGYGYLMRSGDGLFAAVGAYGQLICLRDYPITIGITAGASDCKVAEICLEYLKRALSIPCPAGRIGVSEKRLYEKLCSLSLPLPEGEREPQGAFTGVIGKSILLQDNPHHIRRLTVRTGKEEELLLCLESDGNETVFRAGYGRWIRNCICQERYLRQTAALAYAFEADVLKVTAALINTPYLEEYRLDAADGFRCTWKSNAGYLGFEPGRNRKLSDLTANYLSEKIS